LRWGRPLRAAEKQPLSSHGTAPERLIGSGTVVGDPARPLARPLCAYPQVARDNGSGDPYVADSFTCAVPAGVLWLTDR
jgi:hypothetical protein